MKRLEKQRMKAERRAQRKLANRAEKENPGTLAETPDANGTLPSQPDSQN
ncbi:MAG TPA: hypothetical protein VGS20_13010 [Candidatus Acidoferrales bacterium]|nr:hypothetical protein [Candidatus Acidoferrales bacterium]